MLFVQWQKFFTSWPIQKCVLLTTLCRVGTSEYQSLYLTLHNLRRINRNWTQMRLREVERGLACVPSYLGIYWRHAFDLPGESHFANFKGVDLGRSVTRELSIRSCDVKSATSKHASSTSPRGMRIIHATNGLPNSSLKEGWLWKAGLQPTQSHAQNADELSRCLKAVIPCKLKWSLYLFSLNKQGFIVSRFGNLYTYTYTKID